MTALKDYLLFRKFVMPIALQFLFWAGICGILYGSWWLYSHGSWVWILALIFGVLVTRLIFEGLLLRYQSYILLTEIKDKLSEK